MGKASEKKATGAEASKLSNFMLYFRQHWQLYIIFMLPAVLLTVIFRYFPMGGILIAFMEYNPIRGILGSEWVGFSHFARFLNSPDFMSYLMNTLKLSVYGLLWGFPMPILLAFLLAGLFKIIPGAYYFLSMNAAMLKGFFLSFAKEKSGGWAREARSDEE